MTADVTTLQSELTGSGASRRAHGEAGDERSKDQKGRWRLGRDCRSRLEGARFGGKEHWCNDKQPREIQVR